MKSLRILSLTAATLITSTTGLAIITYYYLLLSMAILTINVKIGIVVQAAAADDHFKVVACLPEDSIRYTSQHLQNALSSWQSNSGRITLSSGEIVEARNVALSISSVSIGNDTSSVLPLLCDAIEIHNPSLVLSLLHEQTSFLVKTAAMTSSVPLLTWSGGYRQPSVYHHHHHLVIYQFYSSSSSSFLLIQTPYSKCVRGFRVTFYLVYGKEGESSCFCHIFLNLFLRHSPSIQFPPITIIMSHPLPVTFPSILDFFFPIPPPSLFSLFFFSFLFICSFFLKEHLICSLFPLLDPRLKINSSRKCPYFFPFVSTTHSRYIN